MIKFANKSVLALTTWLIFNPLYAQVSGDLISSQIASPSNSDPIFRNGFYEGVEKTVALCQKNPFACDIITNINNNSRSEEEVKAECRQDPESCGIKQGPNNDGSTEEGKAQCQNNPASCDIEVNLNKDGSTTEGIAQCKNDPASCDIEVNLNNDGSTAEGIAQCQNDPTSCNIEINLNNDGSTAEGITQCQNDPSSCSIIINDNRDGSTEEGIKQCQNDPLSCGISVNPNLNEVIQETKIQCQGNPTSCGINVNNCPVSPPEQPCGPTLVHSFFSLSDGSLHIPAVDVLTAFDGIITTYEAKMKLIPGLEPLSFSIISVVPIEK